VAEKNRSDGEEGRSPDEAVRGRSEDGRLDNEEATAASQRTYRKFSAKQKLEIVLAGLRGDRSVRDVCREQGIAETLYYSWRDKLLEGGAKELAGKDERQAEKELRKRIRELERTLGRKTYELEIAGEALRDLD